jgi:hypothetical protein
LDNEANAFYSHFAPASLLARKDCQFDVSGATFFGYRDRPGIKREWTREQSG